MATVKIRTEWTVIYTGGIGDDAELLEIAANYVQQYDLYIRSIVWGKTQTGLTLTLNVSDKETDASG